MSTFLELCAKLHTEAGIAGNPPQSVTDQLGDNKRIVHNIKQAWHEIQVKRPDWLFLKQEFLITVPASTQKVGKSLLDSNGVTEASRFRNFDRNEMTLYPVSVGQGGEYELEHLNYTYFRKAFLTGPSISASPQYFSLNNQRELVFDYAPIEDVKLRGEFFKAPQVLSAATDEPDMPDYFHDLIVYEALVRYGYFESSSESYEFAKERLAALENQLLIEQLPEIEM